ncbi:unnamed protein product, partial [Mesorhabditis spiculigera]
MCGHRLVASLLFLFLVQAPDFCDAVKSVTCYLCASYQNLKKLQTYEALNVIVTATGVKYHEKCMKNSTELPTCVGEACMTIYDQDSDDGSGMIRVCGLYKPSNAGPVVPIGKCVREEFGGKAFYSEFCACATDLCNSRPAPGLKAEPAKSDGSPTSSMMPLISFLLMAISILDR